MKFLLVIILLQNVFYSKPISFNGLNWPPLNSNDNPAVNNAPINQEIGNLPFQNIAAPQNVRGRSVVDQVSDAICAAAKVNNTRNLQHWIDWWARWTNSRPDNAQEIPEGLDYSEIIRISRVYRIYDPYLRPFDLYTAVLNRALMYAIQFGHLNIVETLIREGAVVENDSQVLVQAAKYNRYDILRFLIEKGADGHSALFGAIQWNDLKTTKIFTENGINPDSKNGTALILACEYADNRLIRYLIHHGAKVNSGNGEALVVACKKGDIEIIKLLIKNGANINDRVISAAQEKGDEGIIKLLKAEKGKIKYRLKNLFKNLFCLKKTNK